MLHYMSWTVYRHITPDGKIYVGCTGKKPEKRWKNGHGYHKNKLFNKAIEDWGWENIKHEILDTDLDEFTAKCLEEYYIFSFRTFVGFSDCNGYNMTLGGDGQVGVKPWSNGVHLSEETRRKKSEAMKGKTPWNKGKKFGPLSEQQKLKLSASLIGKPSPIKGKHLVIIDGKRHYE